MPTAPLTEPASLPHDVFAWPDNCRGKGEAMTIDPRDWTASRFTTRNYFVVEGRITHPDEPQPDTSYMVTTGASLLKLDHQPLLPAILILRLYLTQARRFRYVPPAHTVSHPARYDRGPMATEEETCTTVRIRHNGDTLIDIAVRDD